LSSLSELFDVDLCETIQNVIQAPVRLDISPVWVEERYSENELEDVRRLKRFVKQKNIRKFFAPLHYHAHDEHPVAKLLYGTGNLEYIGRKK
jgi:hypothetical protein